MTTKYDKMSMKELKKIAKSIGFEPIYSDGTSFSKDVLADSIHQFDGAGLLKKTVRKSAGMTVGRANYPDKKKPQEGPMYDPRKTTVKKKKKIVKKKSGGSVGTHNRLY